MIKKFLFSVAIFSTFAISAQQSFSGINTSQYGAMYKGTTNPANFVDGMNRFAINVVSIDASFGNNKMGLNLDLKKSFNDFTSQASSHNDINADVNLDVLGPSFYFHVGRKNAFAFTSRARVFMDARGIDAKVLESFLLNSSDLNLSPSGYSFNLDKQNVSANAFSEFAFTWARLLAKTSNHSLKAGITAKFVRGAISTYAGFSEINGNIKANLIENNNDAIVNINVQGNQNAEFLLSNGGINVTKSPKFNDILKSQTSALGFDFGFVYEYRKEGCPSCTTTPYDLKLGFSFTDIGRLKYSATEDSQRYSLNVGSHNINLSDVQKSMDESLFVSKTSLKGASIISSLPTSLRLNADVRITGPIFVDVSANFNITNTSKVYNTSYASGFVITPRVEWKYIGFYLPMSSAIGMGTNVGTAVRLGPLFIGSRSIVSNLMSKNAKELNLFGGLQFEI
ncbi:DUF5723 family protein [Capnocytophaga stomatis]|uniref:DUF5723 family protein n=1 Tax=Capnocytophaga stomatis TaxID=1848904 RepID=UPI001BB41509|nr:DUF5723 family protein [Capnocytophaga stomatis]